MFALWYLSLALEELSKRFGWTFFDIFKSKKTANAALDLKPSTSKNSGPAKETFSRNDPSKPTEKALQPMPENPPKASVSVPAGASVPISTPAVPAPAPAPILRPVPAPAPAPTPAPAPLTASEQTPPSPPAKAPTATPPIAPSPVSKADASPPPPKSASASMPEQKQKPKTPTTPEMPTLNKPFERPTMPAEKPEERQKPTTPKSKPNKNSSSATAATDKNLDRKLAEAVSSNKPLENGDAKLKAKLKDATNDFLASEAKLAPFTTNNKQPAARPAKGRDSGDMVDAAVLTKLEEGFAKLAASDSKSLLKKYLTKEVFDNLKNKKTPTFGSTLLDCIQSGLENHDSGVGIYAPDAEAYTVFSDLFDPIIEDYHGGFKKTDKHPPKNFGDVNCFGNLDPNNEFVISTRVRCGRSMQGYPFNPCLTEAQYKEMEEKVSCTLSGLEGELKGKFYPLTGMEKSVQQQLIDDHFLFKEGDRFLQAANACRYWPSGRGIYHNDNKTFLVWCNEEDHLRIISMQMGGDLGEVFRRLTTAVNDIEKRIPFSHDDRLGFLTFCPTNLGTTIRASVHIKVPKLAANKAKLEEVAAKYNLQVRGTRGEHTEAEGGVYDISNKRRMGLTEFDAVKEMNDGILEIIKLEKSM